MPARLTHFLSRAAAFFYARLLTPLAIVLVLGVFGWEMAAYKWTLVERTQFVGHADEAAYAAMGRSLAAGKGLDVNYISWFFIPYDQNITRREDHWPPFMGLCIAPFFKLYGVSAPVAKIPAILIGSLGLPLATALLAWRYSRRGYIGLIAGLCMLANFQFFAASLTTLSDLATAMLVTFFLWALLAARQSPWMHLLAGTFAALAYLAKGSELILLPLYPLLAALMSGPRALIGKWTYAGLALAVLLLAPVFYGTWKAYGNPLHSTQNFVSGYIGLESWESGTYRYYWGKDLPKTSDRWDKYKDRYWRFAERQRAELTRMLLLGTDYDRQQWDDFGPAGLAAEALARSYDFDAGVELARATRYPAIRPETRPLSAWRDPLPRLYGLAAAGTVAVVLTAGTLWALSLLTWRCARRWATMATTPTQPTTPQPAPPAERPPPFLLFPTLAILLVLSVHVFFVAYFWEAQPRFAYVLTPLVAALGVTGALRLLELPVGLIGLLLKIRARALSPATRLLLTHWHVPVTLAVAAFFYLNLPTLKADFIARQKSYRSGGYPFQDQLPYVRLGRYISSRPELAHAVIMTRNPWELLFYCPETVKAVNVPYAKADVIFSAARYYRATYILNDASREDLHRYFWSPSSSPNAPRLDPVHHDPSGLTLYKLTFPPPAP